MAQKPPPRSSAGSGVLHELGEPRVDVKDLRAVSSDLGIGHAHACVVEDRPEAALALGDGSLRLQPRADILADRDEDAMPVGLGRADDHLQWKSRAVDPPGRDDAALAQHGAGRLLQAKSDGRGDLLPAASIEVGIDTLADQAAGPRPDRSLRRPVGEPNPARVVERQDTFSDAADHAPHPVRGLLMPGDRIGTLHPCQLELHPGREVAQTLPLPEPNRRGR